VGNVERRGSVGESGRRGEGLLCLGDKQGKGAECGSK
jgi:hypothetical protein